LLQNGIVKFYATEQQFLESHNDKPWMPAKAFNYCLSSMRISITDIDCIVYCQEPNIIFLDKDLAADDSGSTITKAKIKNYFGYNGDVISISPQNAYAAFHYHNSGFGEAFITFGGKPSSWCSIGAAMEAYANQKENGQKIQAVHHFMLGPEYSNEHIEHDLRAMDLAYSDFCGREAEMIDYIIDMINMEKTIGWFQGKAGSSMEYMPSRIVLAAPVRRMEALLASALLNEDGIVPIYYLEINNEQKNRSEPINCMKKTSIIQSTVNVDSNSTPLLYKLMKSLNENTQYGSLISTPLRLSGENNNSNLYDAIKTFIIGKIDVLVLGRFVLEREKNLKPSVSWLRVQLKNL